jgi:hypothetical protein
VPFPQFTANKIRWKDHMDVLRAVLPGHYLPLQANGNGKQQVYLSELPPNFAEVLAGLIGKEARSLILARELESDVASARITNGDDLDVWERRIEAKIATDESSERRIGRRSLGPGEVKGYSRIA